VWCYKFNAQLFFLSLQTTWKLLLLDLLLWRFNDRSVYIIDSFNVMNVQFIVVKYIYGFHLVRNFGEMIKRFTYLTVGFYTGSLLKLFLSYLFSSVFFSRIRILRHIFSIIHLDWFLFCITSNILAHTHKSSNPYQRISNVNLFILFIRIYLLMPFI